METYIKAAKILMTKLNVFFLDHIFGFLVFPYSHKNE